MKKALITGVTGQDGAYLSHLLLSKGYEVHGIVRRSSSRNTIRIENIIRGKSVGSGNFTFHYGDLTDGASIFQILKELEPDEIYNLGAQSDVKLSFSMPEYTLNVDAASTLRVLEGIRNAGLCNKTRLYQASTSELYGKVVETPQSETTPFFPRSPYAVAKLYAYWIIVNFREAYGIYASNGILFNHESPLRGEMFVTQKICNSVASIEYGEEQTIQLGNLDAKRDWGHAKEYVEGMWRILQHHQPDDFVLATGRTETVRRFVELAFQTVKREIVWEGEGVDEIGRDKKTGEILVKVNPEYFRPAEVDLLLGDPSKAKAELGWQAKIGLEELVNEMMEAALERRKNNTNSTYHVF